MGLWDNIGRHKRKENPYLANEGKALELILSLLPKKNLQYQNTIEYSLHILSNIITDKLIPIIQSCQFEDEKFLIHRLTQLKKQLADYQRLSLINNKHIIGVGGQFSAGKSRFINSILSSEKSILPENTTTTTSIPTYILNGNGEKAIAYLNDNSTVVLEDDAINAITHKFYNIYQVGFAEFLHHLVINVKDFKYKHVVVIDTPGYSKVSVDSKNSISDEKIAINQLKNVDSLIWLVDIENGIIKYEDIEFIKSLQFEGEILIVFNKADKKTEADIENILEVSKKTLDEHNVEIFDITAYSSQQIKEYFNRETISQFFQRANKNKIRRIQINRELSDIILLVEKNIRNNINGENEEIKGLDELIDKNDFVESLRSIILLKQSAVERRLMLIRNMSKLKKLKKMAKKLYINLGLN